MYMTTSESVEWSDSTLDVHSIRVRHVTIDEVIHVTSTHQHTGRYQTEQLQQANQAAVGVMLSWARYNVPLDTV